MNPKVDEYLSKVKNFKAELEKLRLLIIDCGLIEEVKWRQPCYTFNGSNIVIIGEFKEYCSLMFFKGALLHDANKILIQLTENVQAARVIKFTTVKEIIKLQPVIKNYIYEAIEIEKAGLKVEYKKNTELVFPEELEKVFSKNKAFKTAFFKLTPGRQRAYNLFFTAAKQSKTKEERIEKYKQQILNGKGLNDCTCGLSKKMPTCDGSHKYLNKL